MESLCNAIDDLLLCDKTEMDGDEEFIYRWKCDGCSGSGYASLNSCSQLVIKSIYCVFEKRGWEIIKDLRTKTIGFWWWKQSVLSGKVVFRFVCEDV